MIILRNHINDKVLIQFGETKELFKLAFEKMTDRYGLGTGPEKTAAKLGKSIGVGWPQIRRYINGDLLPSLETFAKICIKFQVSPNVLLGLVWQDNRLVKNGAVTTWHVKDDLRLGGFRLYWDCDNCKTTNIEYLDPDGIFLEKLERANLTAVYQNSKIKAQTKMLSCLSLMCENCGMCFDKLKDFETWKKKQMVNTNGKRHKQHQPHA